MHLELQISNNMTILFEQTPAFHSLSVSVKGSSAVLVGCLLYFFIRMYSGISFAYGFMHNPTWFE